MTKRFDLVYTATFFADLYGACSHIRDGLQNPSAASKLVEECEIAIHQRLLNPEAFPVYYGLKKRLHDYRRINVGHYSIFYVVVDKTMEVRRLVYQGRNIGNKPSEI